MRNKILADQFLEIILGQYRSVNIEGKYENNNDLLTDGLLKITK